MSETFGLWAYCPTDAPVAWGARAIFKNGVIDLLHDRQSVRGDAKAFVEQLNRALPEARREAKRLYRTGELSGRESNLVILYLGPGVKILANTNASGGYLYLIAFPSAATEQTVPVPVDQLPEASCGKDYSEHDDVKPPKRAKYMVRSGGFVRFFTTQKAGQNWIRKMFGSAPGFWYRFDHGPRVERI